MKKKELIISGIIVGLAALTTGFTYFSIKQNSIEKAKIGTTEQMQQAASKKTDEETKTDKVTNVSGETKNNEVPKAKAEIHTNNDSQSDLNPFANGITRQALNGYYKVKRNNGWSSYAHISPQGLSEFVDNGNGNGYLNFYKLTPYTIGSSDVFKYQLDGEVTTSTFTKINSNELAVNQPSFNDDQKSMIYKRISKSEYEKGAAKLLVDNDEFSSLGDYYFGNTGWVGTMSTVEGTITINGEKYKVIKSNKSDKKVIASLYGQTYDYTTYEKTNKLVESYGLLYPGLH